MRGIPRETASVPGLMTVILLVGVLCPASTRAGIDTTPAVPTEGETTRIAVTDADGAPVEGAVVQAVYRPQSEVEHVEEVGVTTESGTLSWTPSGAGVVTLEAVLPAEEGTVSKSIPVRFRGVPLTGLLTLVLAGLILYGSVFRGFRTLDSPPPPLPPDT